MATAARVDDAASAFETLAIVDLSCLQRFGVKGPQAEGVLRALGVALPSEANSWVALEGDGLVARLGRSEFLLEDGAEGSTVARVRGALENEATTGVYAVPRQDLALALTGPPVSELFAQTCSFDLHEFERKPNLTVMTMMMEVSVTLVAGELAGRPGFRVWCDGTFGTYFYERLLEITVELGGGAAGICDLYPEARALAAA
jgi:sarcosine oxidase subunit gamma